MALATIEPPETGSDLKAPIRVMVCDDSLAIRAIISRILGRDSGIEVVAQAPDGKRAAELLRGGNIDVIVLDVEMPVLDGLSSLPVLLRIDPSVRIIMASALTTAGGAITMQALQAGAADYVPKPASNQAEEFARELLAKVKGQGRLRRLARRRSVSPKRRASGIDGPSLAPQAASSPAGSLALRPRPPRTAKLLAIGSSTGGPQALFSLFQALSAPLQVPIIVTQHMPPVFTRSLAEHINRIGQRSCAEARHGDLLRPDQVLVAPGDRHMTIQAHDGALRVVLTEDPPENSCRPAVDPMLRTASAACDGRVLAVILTGMGQDGLRGAQDLVAAGGAVLAQDEPSSVVWGMPGAVARAGLCHAVLPIPELAGKIMQMLNRQTLPGLS